MCLSFRDAPSIGQRVETPFSLGSLHAIAQEGTRFPHRLTKAEKTTPLNHSGIVVYCLGQLLRSPLESNQGISHLLDESLCHLS